MLRFEFDIITPGLNGPKGLIRSHFRERKKLKDKLQFLILEQWNRRRFKGKVKVTYIRYSTGSLDPLDNLPSSAKLWIDALVKCTIIEDDSEEFLEPVVKQVKVKTRKEHKTVIEIQSL